MIKKLLLTVTAVLLSACTSSEKPLEDTPENMKPVGIIENAAIISHTINIRRNIDDVFAFFIDNGVSENYKEISPAHEYFTLREGTSLKEGSVIDCEEHTANQHVRHTYVVNNIEKNRRIAYVSKPSQVTVKVPFNTIHTQSNSHVFYDFAADGDNTLVRLTIAIQFPSKSAKRFAVWSGGVIPWEKHCAEELEGLGTVMLREID